MSNKNKRKQSFDQKLEESMESPQGNPPVDSRPDEQPVNPHLSKDYVDKLNETQNEKAAKRIADLEAQLAEAQAGGVSNAKMIERISFLEGKLQNEKTEEELYQERKTRYLDNVAKRKSKEARKAQALADIENSD